MEIKLSFFVCCKLIALTLGLGEGEKTLNCSNYVLLNDFKNIEIRICGNKLFYYEKDYDMGPYIDTCEVSFTKREIVIMKSATNQFSYKRIYYSENKKGIFLVFKQSHTKTKKMFIPEKSENK